MRDLVAELSEAKLSPAFITAVQGTVKEVVGSAIDKQGNQLYPIVWNAEFIDAPVIDPKSQKTPIISLLEANTAILAAGRPFDTLFLLAAGSGLRISELLALQARPEPNSSYFDPTRQILAVNKSKTDAGIREVDLFPALSEYLVKRSASTGSLFPVSRQTAYNAAEEYRIPGYHSFRRFRATHLESNSVPDSLMKFWLGHAGVDITDRYVKIGSEIETRKDWATKVGIGVSIP